MLLAKYNKESSTKKKNKKAKLKEKETRPVLTMEAVGSSENHEEWPSLVSSKSPAGDMESIRDMVKFLNISLVNM